MSGKKTFIALGYFDSVHKGHKAVLSATKAEAEKAGAVPAVFTFGGNLKGKLSEGNCVFSLSEREDVFNKLGFDEIFFAPVSNDFLSLSPESFLEFINGKYDIAGYACGEDYRFGKDGAGDVELLKSFAKKNGQIVTVVPFVKENGNKISTTMIKNFLSCGDVKSANALLGDDYFIKGVVFEDRKVGRTIGFPTLNLKADKDKCELKNGVYSGYVNVCGIKYSAVINYGSRPTFDLDEKLVEAHLIGFDGSLYGETVSVCFTDYLRDIKKFSDKEQLKKQLEKDVLSVMDTEKNK